MNFSSIILAAVIALGRKPFKEIRALIDQGEPQKALEIIEVRLPETAGKRRQTLMELAILASMKASDWDRAIKYGKEFAFEFPESKKLGEIFFYVAKAYMGKHSNDSAAVFFFKAYSSRGPAWVKDSSYTNLFGIVGIGTDLFHNLISRGCLDKRITPTNKVALIIPRSGQLSSLGEDFLRGFLLSLPSNVELSVFDTRSDTNYAALLVDELKDSIFSVVVGPITSVFAVQIAPRFDSVAMFNLIPGATDLRLGDIGRFVIPFNYTIKMEVEKLVSYAMDTAGVDRFFILYPADAQYIAAAFYFKTLVEKKNGVVVEAVHVPPEGLPFRDEIDLIRRIGRDENVMVFIPAANRGIYTLVSQMKFYDVNPTILGCDEWLNWRRKNELNIVIASPGVGEPDVDREQMVNEFVDVYGLRPSSIAMTGYDAGAIVARLLDNGPISSIAAWQKADSLGIFRGTAGTYILSKTRDFIKLYSFGLVEPAKGGNQWQPSEEKEQ